MSLKGSKTEQNLKDAFAGESQANRRYLYFASKADIEGQNDVAALFRSTAEGETGHAHGHLEFLEHGSGDPATGLPAVLSGETVNDWGFYTQLLYGIRKGGVAGLRGDYVTGSLGDYEQLGLTLDGAPVGRDLLRRERWRLSPNLTWYPSEFSKIRLQYNYDNRADVGVDHSVWLQFEFLLGAHAAHKF